MQRTYPTEEERHQAAVNRTESSLLDGTYFTNHSRSYRSIHGSASMVVQGRDGYAHCLQVLGKMAAQSDAHAQLASAIVRQLPLYQTDKEAAAKVYEVAAKVLSEPFDDVIMRSGPESVRFSQTQKPWSLHTRLSIACWLEAACSKFYLGRVPGIGWCVRELAERERVLTHLAEAAIAR